MTQLSRFKDFSFRKFFAKSSVNFGFFNRNRKREGKEGLEEAFATKRKQLLLHGFRHENEFGLDGMRLGPGKLFDFVFHVHFDSRTKCSLFRHKVDDNLSSPRFGTYGLKYAGRISRD